MKYYLSITIIFFALIIYMGCKKDNSSNNSGGSQSFTPAYITPTQPGIVQVSQNSVSLHINNNATVTAQIFNSNGTLQATQPSFIWSSNNTAIATVANGVITATGYGNTRISVTDGSHGVEYVTVNVVADTATISSQPVFITFNPPVLVLAKGASGSFSYSVTTEGGQSSSAAPSFYSASSAGISVSGHTIQAGSSTGNYNVIAVAGSDTLHGFLQLIVYDPQSPKPDTSWSITKLIDYPILFNKSGLTADPVRLEITLGIVSGGTPTIQTFQTSPDQISIAQSSIVTNTSGLLTSAAAGVSEVYVMYKGKTITCYTQVLFDATGSWSGSNLALCFQYPDYISYFNEFTEGFQSTGSLKVSGSCAGADTVISINGWGLSQYSFNFGGYYSASGSIVITPPYGATVSSGTTVMQFWPGNIPYLCRPALGYLSNDPPVANLNYQDVNHVKLTTPSGNVITFTRGTNCVAGGGGGGNIPDTASFIIFQGTTQQLVEFLCTNDNSNSLECEYNYGSSLFLSIEPSRYSSTSAAYPNGTYNITDGVLANNSDLIDNTYSIIPVYILNNTTDSVVYAASSGTITINGNLITFNGYVKPITYTNSAIPI